MISCSSLGAIVVRYARLYRRDLNLLLSIVYWPLLDILIWGSLGSWIQKSGGSQFHNYESVALCSILLWRVVVLGGNNIMFSLQEELLSHNIVNLFSLPLRISEWIIGIIIFSIITIMLSTIFSIFLILCLYSLSLWSILSTFSIFLLPLIFSCIWLGFTSLISIILLGKRGIELGFVITRFFLPFSGALYPIEILPQWGQTISAFLPMSYIFQGMRSYLMIGQNPAFYLLKGSLLGAFYSLSTIILFVHCFNHSKQKGLARLTD